MEVIIKDLKREALKLLKGRWKTPILLTLFLMIITVAIPLAIEIHISGGLQEWVERDETPLSADLINYFISIVSIPLAVSCTWYYLGFIRDEKQNFGQVVSIYKNITVSLKLAATNLVVGVLVLLWMVLLIVPGIIKALSYSQVFYLMKDYPELTMMQAIKESQKRMEGYKKKYLLLSLSFLGWGILGLATLGIGFIWLVPYMSTTYSLFYKEHIYNQ